MCSAAWGVAGQMSREGIEILGYDEAAGELRVTVQGAHRYDFFDVPGPVYQAILAAESRLRYFHAEIWNRFEKRAHWGGLDDLLGYLAADGAWFESPVTVRARAADGDTPLHFASVWGDLGAVELLLEGGADPDAAGDLGCTPLYY